MKHVKCLLISSFKLRLKQFPPRMQPFVQFKSQLRREKRKRDRQRKYTWAPQTLHNTPVMNILKGFLGHRSHRLQWPIVITRCPSVRRPLNYLHFRLLLQNRLVDFDETWYGWSTQCPLQVLLFFGQTRPGADPGRGKNRSRGVPFFRKLLLQTGRLQQQTECIAVI